MQLLEQPILVVVEEVVLDIAEELLPQEPQAAQE
jgi:hypothetical protein